MLRLSNPTRNSTNPRNPPEPESKTAWTDHSDSRWRVAAHKTRHLWVGWRVSSPKTQATWPKHITKNFQRYLEFSGENIQKPAFSGENLLETHQIGQDTARSHRDLVQIWRDLARSRWDPVSSRHDLARSCRIWPKWWHQRWNPKPTGTTWSPTQPKPADLTSISGQLRVPFSPTQQIQVKFGSGTNPTRGHP